MAWLWRGCNTKGGLSWCRPPEYPWAGSHVMHLCGQSEPGRRWIVPSSRRVQFLASGGLVTNIKVEIQKLELTRHGDFFPPRDKFPRLVRTDAKARSREIKKLLPSL